MLDPQGDQELIFDHVTGRHQHLTALHLPASVDDSAWATAPLDVKAFSHALLFLG